MVHESTDFLSLTYTHTHTQTDRHDWDVHMMLTQEQILQMKVQVRELGFFSFLFSDKSSHEMSAVLLISLVSLRNERIKHMGTPQRLFTYSCGEENNCKAE